MESKRKKKNAKVVTAGAVDNTVQGVGTETVDKDFAYLDLLDDNSPRHFPEYNAEARILKKQIDSPSVCNIAVVAKYGAGKSSVINTYLHNYRRTDKERKKGFVLGKPEDNRYTRITLSTFNNIAYDEAAIERSILQQLLYSRKKSELPNSEIKRTNKTPVWQTVIISILLLAFIASAVLFGIEASGALIFGAGKESLKFWFFGAAALLLFGFIFWLIHYRKLSKIKYRDFEVDIRSEDDGDKPAHTTSLINKFVDEVLYFFDCVNIDLVIFEDLDRLPTTEIFAKLRELNTIINGSRKSGGKVTFLYAAKDDLFKTEEERAKFFEFILPVVPVINQVTTSEELRKQLEKLEKRNADLALTEKFIKGISTYIPDMRILKNTLNDYIIMYSKIFEDTDAKAGYLSKEKLFALSLYKNLYPYDYALLEKNVGLIRLVVNMDKLREQSIVSILTKIKEARERLEAIKAEKLKSVKELKIIFQWQLKSYSYRGRSHTDPQSPIDIMDDSVSFIGLNHSHVAHWQHSSYFIAFPQGTTEVFLPNGDRFADRESIIVEQIENGGNATRTLIANLEKERQAIFGLSFFDLVKKQSVDACFPDNLLEQYLKKYRLELQEPQTYNGDDEKVKEKAKEFERKVEIFKKQIEAQIRYLRFLVVNGYIDEKYIEYTSNYKAQLITQKDAQFVADIQIKKQDFDYMPDDIKSVVGRLDDEDFLQTPILNKRILDSIELIKVLDSKEGTNKHKNLLELLAKTTEPKVLDAICNYITTAEIDQIDTLLEALIPLRSTLCAELLIDGKLDSSKADILVACVIKYGAADYNAQNTKNKLADYLSEHGDYLGLLLTAGEDSSIALIKAIQPTFKQLSREVLDGAIQRHIIANNRYALTLQNLEVIFKIADTENLSADFYARHFGYIMASGKESVIKHITADINKYASAVLLKDKVTFAREEQEQVEMLLKNESIDIETRKAIIRKCNIQIVDIAEFDTGLYYTLLDEGKVEPTWENTIKAYSEIGYKDEGVENYILNTELTGNFAWDGDEKGEDTALELFADIIGNTLTTADSSGKVSATAAIIRILKTIDKQYSLSQFNIAELLKAFVTTTGDYHGKDKMLDFNFAKAIEFGKITYASDDIQRMNPLPHSRNAYLIKFQHEILAEFDTFFDCALPQSTGQQRMIENGQNVYKNTYQAKPNANALIGVVVGANGVSTQIKKTLIEKCLPIIDIKGYERSYAKFFTMESVVVPTRILWQFTSTTAVDEMDKQTMLWLSRDIIDANTEWAEYTAYFDAIGRDWEKVYKKKDKLKIRQNNGTERLLNALKAKGWLTYRRSNKIEELFGGPTFTIEAV
jgi:hypothetical protein